jgi:hypothetical protein
MCENFDCGSYDQSEVFLPDSGIEFHFSEDIFMSRFSRIWIDNYPLYDHKVEELINLMDEWKKNYGKKWWLRSQNIKLISIILFPFIH